jgi:hypothetical protein
VTKPSKARKKQRRLARELKSSQAKRANAVSGIRSLNELFDFPRGRR